MNKKIIIGFMIIFVLGSVYFVLYNDLISQQNNDKNYINNNVGFNELYSFSLSADFPEHPNSAPYYEVVNSINNKTGSAGPVSGWGLPTDEEAILMANDYLISHDLLPEDAVLFIIERLHSITLSPDSNVSEEDSNTSADQIQIIYRREINGYPVVGDNSDSIHILIGLNKEVIYCSKKWKELEEISNIEIIDAEEAYNKLLKNEIKDSLFNQDSYNININEISIGYYASTPSTEQNYYKPVWIFYEKHDIGLDTYFVVDACESE